MNLTRTVVALSILTAIFLVHVRNDADSAELSATSEITTGLDQVWTAGGANALFARGDYVYNNAGGRVLVLHTANPNHLALYGYSDEAPETIFDIAATDEFIYAAGKRGLYIFDAHDHRRPDLVGVHAAQGGDFNTVTVKHNFAYLASDDGLRIVDVGDPTQPVETGSSFNAAVDVVVEGHLAYVLTGVSLDIVDISNPSNPQIIGVFYGQELNAITVGNGYAYLTSVQGHFIIVDVSDPTAPVEISRVDAYGEAIGNHGDYVYLTGGTWDVVTIDVSDPGNPEFLQTHRIPGLLGPGVILDLTVTDAGELYANIAGRIVRLRKDETRVNHELSGYGPGEARTALRNGRYLYVVGDRLLHILDIRYPELPHEISTLPLSPFATDFAVTDGYLFMADAYNGLRIIDVSDAHAPQEVGYQPIYEIEDVEAIGSYLYLATPAAINIFDISTPSEPQATMALSFGGEMTRVGDYLFVGSGKLRVIDVSNPSHPTLVSTYEPDGSIREQAASENRIYLFTSAFEVEVLDSSNPENVNKIGSFNRYDVIDNGIISGLGASENYLVLSNANIFTLVDASQPSEPTVVDVYEMKEGDYLDSWIRSIVPAPGGFDVVANRAGVKYFRVEQRIETPIPPGGRVVQADTVTATFGPGTFQEEIYLSYVPLNGAEMPSVSIAQPVSPPFKLAAVDNQGVSIQPTQRYTLTVEYDDSGMTPLAEASLQLMRWNDGAWQTEPTEVDVQNNIVAATPQAFGTWLIAAPFKHGLFLPQIADSYAFPDLILERLEVTQHVQRPDNDVPLLTGKPAALRAYARTTGALPAHDVTMTVSATRNGQPLVGSPLTVGPWTVYAHPNPATWAHQFNVTLPDAWLSGNVNISATLEADGMHETQADNNTEAINVQFKEVPPLRLVLVPVHWQDTFTENRCDAPSEDWVSAYVRETFPINDIEISFREPLYFEGSLRNDPWALIDKLLEVKVLDGVSHSTVYYGLVSSGATGGESCNGGGLAGMAGGRSRVSFGGFNSPRTAAHEIGHNFGLPHAPCGGAADPDPDYPYPNGSTGYPVYQVAGHLVVAPRAPDFNKDEMGYCAGYGFSDYNYEKLFEDQLVNGDPLAAGSIVDALYVRVSLNGDKLDLLPTYRIRSELSTLPDKSDYAVQLRDSQGQVIAVYSLRVIEGEENGIKGKAVQAMLPLPDGEVASIQLLHQGRPVATRAFDVGTAGDDFATLFQDGDATSLRWTQGEPVAIRFTADEGRTWTTLAYDVTSGRFAFDAIPPTLGDGQIQILRADSLQPTPAQFTYEAP